MDTGDVANGDPAHLWVDAVEGTVLDARAGASLPASTGNVLVGAAGLDALWQRLCVPTLQRVVIPAMDQEPFLTRVLGLRSPTSETRGSDQDERPCNFTPCN